MATYYGKTYTLPKKVGYKWIKVDKDQGTNCFMKPPAHPYYFVQSIYANGNYTPSHIPNYYYEPKDIFVDALHELDRFWDGNKLNYNNERVGYWEKTAYSHFNNCYSRDGKDRSASNCVVDRENEKPPNHHLAFLLINKYYPEAEPKLGYIKSHPKFYGIGFGVGDWWTTLEIRPTPKNCKPRSLGIHPTINPDLCNWCGMGKDPVN